MRGTAPERMSNMETMQAVAKWRPAVGKVVAPGVRSVAGRVGTDVLRALAGCVGPAVPSYCREPIVWGTPGSVAPRVCTQTRAGQVRSGVLVNDQGRSYRRRRRHPRPEQSTMPVTQRGFGARGIFPGPVSPKTWPLEIDHG